MGLKGSSLFQERRQFLHIQWRPLGGGCEGAILLRWPPAEDDTGPVTYHVFRAEEAGGQDFESPLASTTALGFADDTVPLGVEHWYVVQAEDPAGNRETNAVELHARAVGALHHFAWSSLDPVQFVDHHSPPRSPPRTSKAGR